LVGKGLINKDAVSLFDIATIFPLYLYTTPETTRGTLFATQETSREPNLAPAFIRDITARLGLKFIKDGLGDLTTSLGPEDIFHYAYAVFHSPTYRSRYAEFLKIDFPRLPLTTNLSLFRHLCQFGADLVALHLLEDDYPAASWNRAIHDSSFIIHHSPFASPAATFVERQTGTTVGSMSKSSAYDKGRVYLDTSNRARSSYFEGVPEEVWNFHIGGYQVCHKWLYDRRGSGGEPGRTLNPEDIEHYRRVVVALKETMRLMAEIDAVIEDHGGWPLVGSVGDK
jgi:predicted helicase